MKRLLSIALVAGMAATSGFAGYNEEGYFEPKVIGDCINCAAGGADGYLFFDQAITCCGLVYLTCEDTGIEYAAGAADLKLAKTDRDGRTKWTETIKFGNSSKKLSVSQSSRFYIESEYDDYVFKDGYVFSSPSFDWPPFGFVSSIGEGYSYDCWLCGESTELGRVYGGIVDPKQGALSRLNKKSFVVKVIAGDIVNGDAPDSIFATEGLLTIAIGAKGSVKVTGRMPDGNKVNVSSYVTGLYYDRYDDVGYAQIPVYIQNKKKNGGVGFIVYLNYYDDGHLDAYADSAYWQNAGGMENFVETYFDVGEIGGLEAGRYSFDGSDALSIAGEYAETLYRETSSGETWAEVLDYGWCDGIRFDGRKFVMPKAGSVKLKRYTEDGDSWYDIECSNDENPIGLKLSYKEKTGEIKGSFTAYILVTTYNYRTEKETQKIQNFKIDLSGTVFNGEVSLTASAKKYDPCEAYLNFEEVLSLD